MRARDLGLSLAAVVGAMVWTSAAQTPVAPSGSWQFLVSGDSRNCGDVVMPGIAETAKQHAVDFFWHLGDFRAVYTFDEDIQHQPAYRATPIRVGQYLTSAWPDFIEKQVKPFGATRVMLGIGNHELIPPFTREDYLIQFADWLDMPALRDQRLADDPADHRMRSYYHWIERGVDFIFIDNASNDQVDPTQLEWITHVLDRASANPAVTTIVMGMHKALPGGYTPHSMDESPAGIESGRQIYAALLEAQNHGHKRVYMLASHLHAYIPDEYDTPYWRDHGGVLPGWVIGTGGAARYPLPVPSPAGAMTKVYGSLLATVLPGGEIQFAYQQLNEADIPAAVTSTYGQDFVHWCFAENMYTD